MSAPDASRNNLYSAEYWHGLDILDPATLTGAPEFIRAKAGSGEVQTSFVYLSQAVGSIAAGNCTEIRYDSDIFDSSISDGSVVVFDKEQLSWSNRPEVPHNTSDESDNIVSPKFVRPYSDYWLRYQSNSQNIGLERTFFPDKSVLYMRSLNWGVLMSFRGQRFIQPFEFNRIRLLQGKFIMFEKPELALPLPVSVGREEVMLDLKAKTGTTHMIERIRSIDVVHPVSAKREPEPDAHRQSSRAKRPAWAFPKLLPGLSQ